MGHSESDDLDCDDENYEDLLAGELAAGTLRIGAVRVESKISDCSIGASYLGVHEGLDVPVAVRTLRPKIKAEMPDFERFVKRARGLGRIRHPNISGVLDIGDYKDHHYAVVEAVMGVPLAERIKQRPLGEAQALKMLIPIAEGLAELWRKGFIHRSISPYLIHIQHDGGAKLDMTALTGEYADPVLKSYMAPCLAPYWSPEEVRDQDVGPASDMWSFGAVLYHAVTGKMPFGPASCKEKQASAVAREIINPRVANPQLHVVTSELLLKLLDKDPKERFLSAEAFLAALRSVEAQLSQKTEVVTSPFPTPVPDPVASKAFDVGDVIGNTKLVKKLGAGAFGVVYLARHQVLDIDVAVKLLPMESAYRDPSFIQLFLREARTAARIRHRNVIGIFEAGVQNGQHFIIMELASGGTVYERMELHGGKLPADEVARIMLDAARGLAAAEGLNIVHRDIKPDNLMFSADGDVKIADLGLAKRLLPKDVQKTIRESLVADQLSQNDAGMMAGTPAYMAPEIAVEPQKADTRADLYSLGVTAWHMLMGRLPFEGKTSLETIMKHVLEEVEAPRELDNNIPEGLSKIVARLMQKRPEQRYQSARELVKELETIVPANELAAA